jgi:hypothetical protein
VNRCIDLYTVKEWLGHADITTTQKYAHLSPQKLAYAAAVLEKEAKLFATFLTQILHIDARDTNSVCSYLFDIISLEMQ